jgi:hypothetical protein
MFQTVQQRAARLCFLCAGSKLGSQSSDELATQLPVYSMDMAGCKAAARLVLHHLSFHRSKAIWVMIHSPMTISNTTNITMCKTCNSVSWHGSVDAMCTQLHMQNVPHHHHSISAIMEHGQPPHQLVGMSDIMQSHTQRTGDTCHSLDCSGNRTPNPRVGRNSLHRFHPWFKAPAVQSAAEH